MGWYESVCLWTKQLKDKFFQFCSKIVKIYASDSPCLKTLLTHFYSWSVLNYKIPTCVHVKCYSCVLLRSDGYERDAKKVLKETLSGFVRLLWTLNIVRIYTRFPTGQFWRTLRRFMVIFCHKTIISLISPVDHAKEDLTMRCNSPKL